MGNNERNALIFAIGYLESTANGMKEIKPEIAEYASELLKLIEEKLTVEEKKSLKKLRKLVE